MLRTATVFTIALSLFTSPCLADSPKLQSDDDRVLYALGVKIMLELAPYELSQRELAIVQSAMRDSMKGEFKVDPAQYYEAMHTLAQKRVEKRANLARDRGLKFVRKMRRFPGAKVAPSGMVWFDLRAGNGPKPQPTSQVKVHYRGTLIDGTEFDSSYKRGEPAVFTLQQVIPCWTEGITQLQVGGKAKLICPPEVAYGDRGAAPIIPPGATLVFEVELLDIVQL